MTMAFPKRRQFRSQRFRDFAHGQTCTLLMPWCNRDPATVVLCHVREPGTGIGTKPHDWWGYHGCSECHRRESEAGDEDIRIAVFRTMERLYFAGMLKDARRG